MSKPEMPNNEEPNRWVLGHIEWHRLAIGDESTLCGTSVADETTGTMSVYLPTNEDVCYGCLDLILGTPVPTNELLDPRRDIPRFHGGH